MYNPPSQVNWQNSYLLIADYINAYNEGYQAAKKGFKKTSSPYTHSGRVKDVESVNDEIFNQWNQGYEDYDR